MNRRPLATLAIAASVLLSGTAAGSDNPPAPDANAILQSAARSLAQAPGFSVTIRSEYDAVQADGQRITFGEQRQVHLQRPAQLRIDARRSDGESGMLLFDGKAVTTYKPAAKAYARAERPGTVDDTVVYLVRDLQMTIPLARLLLTTLPAELASLATSVQYVERNQLTNPPSDHLAIRTADVDVQLWVTADARPLPQRIVITYREQPGQPQFRADLSGWQLAAPADPALFQWTPPPGTEQLPLLAPLRQPAEAPATQGDQP